MLFAQLTEIEFEETFHDNLKGLLALPQKLVRISLGKLMAGRYYPTDLEELLRKHGQYLERLAFDLRIQDGDSYRLKDHQKFQDIPEDVVLKFPAMPELKELEIYCDNEKILVENGPEVRYAVHFPKLRSLTLGRIRGYEILNEGWDVWSMFFGDTEQIVANVELTINWKGHEHCEDCFELEKVLKEMFPRWNQIEKKMQ